MIVVPVDGHLPVVDTLGEANVPQDNAVILVVAGKCHVLVGEDDVLVGCPRVRWNQATVEDKANNIHH